MANKLPKAIAQAMRPMHKGKKMPMHKAMPMGKKMGGGGKRRGY